MSPQANVKMVIPDIRLPDRDERPQFRLPQAFPTMSTLRHAGQHVLHVDSALLSYSVFPNMLHR